MTQNIKTLLDEKYFRYRGSIFLEPDPIQVPHQFSQKEDIEIAAFLTAIIAWGQRPTIIRNANRLMEWMDFAPFDFMMHSRKSDLAVFKTFVHRTFNGIDCHYFISRLQRQYQSGNTLEDMFNSDGPMANKLHHFKQQFFDGQHPVRTQKHLADPWLNAAAKRLNMFLRWMVRKDPESIDFGLWTLIQPRELMCPLDVHTGRTARALGLLQRKQNDWKAVTELTSALRHLNPDDPVKYDIALFAISALEGFSYFE